MSKRRYDRSWRTVTVGRSKDLFAGGRRCSARASRKGLEELVLRKLLQEPRSGQGRRDDLGGSSAEVDRDMGLPLSPAVFEVGSRRAGWTYAI